MNNFLKYFFLFIISAFFVITILFIFSQYVVCFPKLPTTNSSHEPEFLSECVNGRDKQIVYIALTYLIFLIITPFITKHYKKPLKPVLIAILLPPLSFMLIIFVGYISDYLTMILR